MSARRQGWRTWGSAAVLAATLVAGGPPLAAAVFDATNAEKVDGRSAVGAGASPATRAGKLVATNAAGRLPNTIVAGVPNAARLGGALPSAYQRRIIGTCAAGTYVRSVGAAGGVACGTDKIDGGNAQTLDGADSTGFMRAGNRTIVVRPEGTAAENGLTLRQVGLTISSSGAPSATNPWLISLEPGAYDLGNEPFPVPSYVTVQGAGPATVLSAAVNGVDNGQAAVVLQASSQLRSVTVESAHIDATGILLTQPNAVVDGVSIEVSGSQARGIDGTTDATNAEILDVRIVASSTSSANGIVVAASAQIHDADISASALDGTATGITARAGSTTMDVARSRLSAAASNNAVAILQSGTEAVIRDSALKATGGQPYSLFVESTSTVRVVNSLVDGPLFNTGTLTCLGSYSPGYTALNGGCL